MFPCYLLQPLPFKFSFTSLPFLRLLSTWTIKILSTSFHAQFLQTALNVTVCQEVLPFLSYSSCEKKQSNKFPEPFSLQLSAAHSSVWCPCCEQWWKHHTSKDSPRIQTFTWHMVLWPTQEDRLTGHICCVATAWVDEICFLYFSWKHQSRNQAQQRTDNTVQSTQGWSTKFVTLQGTSSR